MKSPDRSIADAGPEWIRLRPVARRLGLDPRLLERECIAGRIPIPVAHFGAMGIAHVRRVDAEQFKPITSGGHLENYRDPAAAAEAERKAIEAGMSPGMAQAFARFVDRHPPPPANTTNSKDKPQ